MSVGQGPLVAVLLSLGRHPGSGRPRRNPADARALDMALALVREIEGARLVALHAGDSTAPALRDYLGQGLDVLHVLPSAPEDDPLPVLGAALRTLAPDLLLTGMRAEGGEDGGLLPYILAERLGHALVPAATSVEVAAGEVRLVQALPRGRRRGVTADLPLTVTIAPPAEGAPLAAYGRARRGRVEPAPAAWLAAREEAAAAAVAVEKQAWRQRPRPQPVRRKGSAVDRLRAMTGGAATGGQLLVDPTPEAAARAILDHLITIGIIRPERGDEDRPAGA